MFFKYVRAGFYIDILDDTGAISYVSLVRNHNRFV
jgi:hypothetical protein